MTQGSASLDDIKRQYLKQIHTTACLANGGSTRRLADLYAPEVAWHG